jgi:hypothetical protein
MLAAAGETQRAYHFATSLTHIFWATQLKDQTVAGMAIMITYIRTTAAASLIFTPPGT